MASPLKLVLTNLEADTANAQVQVEVLKVAVVVEVNVNAVEELKMKLLFCSITVVLLLSTTVFAEKEFVGESERRGVEATTGRVATVCTRDVNQWGHASSCRCDDNEFYNPKIGQCVARELDVVKPTITGSDKPRFVRCTKDRNRWGHSSVCHCSLPGYEYDQRIGRCLFVPEADETHEEDADGEIVEGEVDEENTEEFSEGEGSGGYGGIIAGCEGGEMSPDGLVISCPDGSVFHRSRSTAEDLSRSLAEHVEDRYEEEETTVDQDYYPQPFVGVR